MSRVRSAVPALVRPSSLRYPVGECGDVGVEWAAVILVNRRFGIVDIR
jgi:hypothetical protein